MLIAYDKANISDVHAIANAANANTNANANAAATAYAANANITAKGGC